VASHGRTKVLFVCLGNSCRSPMAEAIAAHIASDVMEVSSAGLVALGHVESMTMATLGKNGYPADGLRSKLLRFADLEDADIVVNMTGCPGILSLDEPKVEDWDVEDPYGDDSETYQRVFMDVERRVTLLVSRVRESRAKEGTVAQIRNKGSGPC